MRRDKCQLGCGTVIDQCRIQALKQLPRMHFFCIIFLHFCQFHFYAVFCSFLNSSVFLSFPVLNRNSTRNVKKLNCSKMNKKLCKNSQLPLSNLDIFVSFLLVLLFRVKRNRQKDDTFDFLQVDYHLFENFKKELFLPLFPRFFIKNGEFEINDESIILPLDNLPDYPVDMFLRLFIN